MDTNAIMHSEIFFIISSVGFIILGIIAIILGILCTKTVASFLRILARIESSMDAIGDTTQELLEDMRNSFVFQMLFRPKKAKRSQKVKKE